MFKPAGSLLSTLNPPKLFLFTKSYKNVTIHYLYFAVFAKGYLGA